MYRSSLALMLCLASGAVAAADTEMGAEQILMDANSNTGVGGQTGQRFAQVFELHDTGAVSHLMLPLGCQPQAVVRITLEATTQGVPSGTVLASKDVPGYVMDAYPTAPGLVGMRMIEFPRAPVLVPGVYAFTVSTKGKYGCVIWYGPAGNSYHYGDAYFIANYNPPGWTPLGRDLAFQVFQRP